jgi:photosystem II stability/assembly factor-like uncharacterized protein
MVDILFNSPENMIFCLTDHGLWETNDGGKTFQELKIPRIFGAKSASKGGRCGKNIVVGIGRWKEKSLIVSHDGGRNFEAFTNIKNNFSFIAFHPFMDNLVYAGPYKSIDSGKHWIRLPHEICAISYDGSTLYALKINKGNTTQLICSKDHGKTFSPFVDLNLPINAVRQVICTPENSILIASAKGVFRIYNNEIVLHDYRYGLSKDAFGTMYTECLAFDPNAPNIIYAGRRSLGRGNGNGIFKSNDNGKNWHEANFNLSPGITVFAIKISPFDSSVYIGTSFGTFCLG